MLTMSMSLKKQDLDAVRSFYNGLGGEPSAEIVADRSDAVPAPQKVKAPHPNTRAQKQAEAIREAKARRNARPTREQQQEARNTALLQGERFEVRRGAEVPSPCPPDRKRTFTVAHLCGKYTRCDVRVYYGHKDTCNLTGNQYTGLHLLDVLDREGRKVLQLMVGPQFRRELMIDHFRHLLLQLRSQK